MTARIRGWLRRRDPELDAVHQAVKVAVVPPVGLAIGTVLNNPQLALFAAFGGVALLLFADFPGNRTARLGANVLLVLVGGLLITLGTLTSTVGWLAVLGMAIVAFGVLFAGVLSAAAAAGTRAALLTFILPVTVPGTAADIPDRLAGWGVAALLAVPAAVYWWAPRDHNELRLRAGDACRALGHAVAAWARGVPIDTQPSLAAIRALRRQFRSTTFLPTGLTTGSRVLAALVDRLDWLHAVIRRALPEQSGHAARSPARRSAVERELLSRCVDVLDACADGLSTAGGQATRASRQRLYDTLRELDDARTRWIQSVDFVIRPGSRAADITTGGLDEAAETAAQAHGLSPALLHALTSTASVAGHTVAVSVAADARPVLDRLLGRPTVEFLESEVAPLAAASRIVSRSASRRSVWFQNSVRGALGLGLAVMLVELTQVAHGFWVCLATMSVLRTTALSIGVTAARAVLGTVVGFLAGAGVLLLVGTQPARLWLILPLALLIAAFLPRAVSFTAGQAAFTVAVVVMFNLIEPTGWTVGLLRVEDIALGGVAALIAGVLLWPGGAAAQIRSALADAYRTSGDALAAATRGAAGLAPPAAHDDIGETVALAKAAAGRLDDAFREYLAERGARSVPVHELTLVSNGANHVRLAATAIAVIRGVPGAASANAAGSGDAALPSPATSRSEAVQGAAEELGKVANGIGQWLFRAADVISSGRPEHLPALPPHAERTLLDSLAADPALSAPAEQLEARTLWQIALYLDDVVRPSGRLNPALQAVIRPASSPRALEREADVDPGLLVETRSP